MPLDLGDDDLPPIDYFEHHDVRCTNCGQASRAEVCLIATERPGLAAAVRSGEVQSYICAHCDQLQLLGGMLLVWRPRQSPRILISPAQGMSKERARGDIETLIGVLQRELGAKFREEWISQAEGLTREELAATLSAGSA